MTPRLAYLAPPRLSFVTTLINIPNLLNLSGGQSPVILMDRYDYDRLRARTLTDAAENQKGLYLLMAFDELCRRDIIQLVDYAEFYSPSTQEKYLRQNQTLLANTPERIHEQLAVDAIENWTEYARGTYQEPFRAALSEDTERFASLRRDEEKQRRKTKRGTGDPRSRTRKTLNKGVAALAIRDQADQMLNYDVQSVICSSQYEILDDFLSISQSSQSARKPSNRASIESDMVDVDTSIIETLEPLRRTVGFGGAAITETQAMMEAISTIATELSGVQHDDWFLLGPSFAVPQYAEIFDWDIICMQIEDGLDVNTLVSETQSAIDGLENGATEGISPEKFEYESAYIAEKFDPPSTPGRSEDNGLRDMVKYAFDLSNYSRELRLLTEQHNISQLAALIGVSIVEGGYRQFNDDDLYQRCVELMGYFDPISIDEMEHQQIRKERQMSVREGNTDWFEATDRWR